MYLRLRLLILLLHRFLGHFDRRVGCGIDLSPGHPRSEFWLQQRAQIEGRIGGERGGIWHERDGRLELWIEDSLMAERKDSSRKPSFIGLGDDRLGAEILEYLSGMNPSADRLVGSLDANAGQVRKVVAAAEDAHIREHIVRPTTEIQPCAVVQTTHIDLPPNSLVQLKEDTAASVHQRVAVLSYSKVYIVVTEKKSQFCISFIRSYDIRYVILPQLVY